MLNYYCSPTGSGNGLTVGAPGSFSTCRTLVQNNIASDSVTVWLRGGLYGFSASQTFTSADCHATNIVRWRGYPDDLATGNVPIFSGGTQITGWTLHDAGLNIWQATVPTGLNFRQLYVNNARATRARWPGYCTSVFSITDANFPTISKPTDLEIVADGFREVYICDRYRVSSCSKVGNTTTFSTGALAWFDEEAPLECGGSRNPALCYVENAYEFLTDPGEWYLNHTTDIVYYIPQPGEELSTSEVFAPVLEKLLVFPANTSKRIKFEDIILEHTSWLIPSTQGHWISGQDGEYFDEAAYNADPNFGVTEPALSGSWWWIMPFWEIKNFFGTTHHPAPAIDITKAEDISFDRCWMRNMGGNGFHARSGSKRCYFNGGRASFISGSPLVLGNRGKDTWWIRLEESLQSQDLVAENNKIHDGGVEYTGSSGITFYVGKRICVRHNEVYNMPYNGICNTGGLPDTPCYSEDCEESYNKIHHTMQVLSDGGATYNHNDCLNYQCHHNYIYHNGNGTTQALHAWLYSDNCSWGHTYHHNLCVDGPGTPSGGHTALMVNVPKTLTVPPVVFFFPFAPFTDYPDDQHRRGTSVTAHNNYATTGMTLQEHPTNDVYYDPAHPWTGEGSPYYSYEVLPRSLEALNFISTDPDLWPQEAKDIAANSGVETLIFGDLIEGTLTVYGWRTSPDEHIDLVLPEGVTQLWYAEPYDDTWVAELDGVTEENISGISVAASAGIIFDRTGTTEISIWDRTGITPITIKAPPYE